MLDVSHPVDAFLAGIVDVDLFVEAFLDDGINEFIDGCRYDPAVFFGIEMF